MNLIFSTLVSLVLGLGILLYLDTNTLFLAALLLSIIAIRSLNRGNFLDKLTGVWFALSVSPAIGVSLNEISDISNGFLIQSLLSALLFVYFYKTKPSIIGRIAKNAKEGVGVIVSSVLCGFTAGILSAALWQTYLSIVSNISL